MLKNPKFNKSLVILSIILLNSPVLAYAQSGATMALNTPSMGPSVFSANTSSSQNLLISQDEKTLAPSMGPLGSASAIDDLPENPSDITTYTVRKGDTLASIAKMFNVTKATILAANDMTTKQALKEGMVLDILPVSGHEYIVKKNDTVSAIAKKTKVPVENIAFYNDISVDEDLNIGDTLIIPDPDFDTLPVISSDNSNNSGLNKTPVPFRNTNKSDLGNLFLRPVDISVSVRTQGAHGWNLNAVDIGARIGTPIHASYDGVVAVATETGWNGGYGKYVVIDHVIDGKKVRTIYGHMSKVIATVGSTVSRGDLIGLVGSTGNSTGPHVHWEIRGALNPMIANARYTGN